MNEHTGAVHVAVFPVPRHPLTIRPPLPRHPHYHVAATSAVAVWWCVCRGRRIQRGVRWCARRCVWWRMRWCARHCVRRWCPGRRWPPKRLPATLRKAAPTMVPTAAVAGVRRRGVPLAPTPTPAAAAAAPPAMLRWRSARRSTHPRGRPGRRRPGRRTLTAYFTRDVDRSCLRRDSHRPPPRVGAASALGRTLDSWRSMNDEFFFVPFLPALYPPLSRVLFGEPTCSSSPLCRFVPSRPVPR